MSKAVETIPVHRWTNGGKRALMVRFSDNNSRSHGGFQWPTEIGAEVEALLVEHPPDLGDEARREGDRPHRAVRRDAEALPEPDDVALGRALEAMARGDDPHVVAAEAEGELDLPMFEADQQRGAPAQRDDRQRDQNGKAGAIVASAILLSRRAIGREAEGKIPAADREIGDKGENAGEDHRDDHQLRVAISDMGQLMRQHRLDLGVGEFGDQSNDVTFAAIGDSRVRHAKGARDAGTLSLTCAHDPLDAGQAAMEAACIDGLMALPW